ncbi:uncharacterized protein [Miscanthus floridulus]|uniref:uncharacterized protein n=1 Tax=Miscanthus floridulus TaxID=154761 RepID=UPI0034594DE9
MGANIDGSMNDGRGPPAFKISGQVHHRIGSLLPDSGQRPKFIQLSIYDTANEVRNRIRALHPDERPSEPLEPAVIGDLLEILDAHNPLAKQFRLARDRLEENGDEELVVRIIGAREGDPVQYNLPTTEQLAMLVVGDFSLDTFQRDIVIQAKSGHLQHISSLHPAFMSLQYPLLFPYGERGYQVGVVYNGVTARGKNTGALSSEPGQKPTDRADIVVRVYNMKLEELLGDIRNGSVFGPVSAAGMCYCYLEI